MNIEVHQHGDLSELTAISQGEGKKPRIQTEARVVNKGGQISRPFTMWDLCQFTHMDGRNTSENASWLKKSIMI